MCGFIAQLVEHRTGITEVMGSNSVEALIFSGFSFKLLKLENILRCLFFTFRLQNCFFFSLTSKGSPSLSKENPCFDVTTLEAKRYN